MEQKKALNEVQMDFLRLLGYFTTVEQVEELRQIVCDYYARKIDDAVDKQIKCHAFIQGTVQR